MAAFFMVLSCPFLGLWHLLLTAPNAWAIWPIEPYIMKRTRQFYDALCRSMKKKMRVMQTQIYLFDARQSGKCIEIVGHGTGLK